MNRPINHVWPRLEIQASKIPKLRNFQFSFMNPIYSVCRDLFILKSVYQKLTESGKIRVARRFRITNLRWLFLCGGYQECLLGLEEAIRSVVDNASSASSQSLSSFSKAFLVSLSCFEALTMSSVDP